LLELKRSSDSNAQSFDSLLSRINAKLDFTDNKPSIDLLRTYIKELTTSVEDKYNTTQNKFSDIEKALRAVYTLQGDQIKNSEIQELFDVFSKNVNNFSVEAKQNKAVLTGIENKISDLINNKTDKEDILRTISLLRKDFENVNNVYKHTIDDVNSNLKTIISGLIKLDPLKTNEAVKSQIDIMFNAINGIVMQLQNFDKKQIALERILAQLATGEDLKITKGIIDEIIEKTSNVENTVNNIANKTDIQELKDDTEELNKKVLTKEDIADLVQQTEDMLNNTQDIKNALGQMTNDIEQKPDAEIIENSLKSIYKKMENLTENISAANVKGDVFDVTTRLTSIKDELYTIKNIVTDLNENINSKVIDAIENIPSEDNIQELKDNISEMLKQIPSKEDIDTVLSDNNNVLKELVTKTAYIAENIGSIPAVIERFSCGSASTTSTLYPLLANPTAKA
jgi:DNA repair ATPase RecN